MKAAGVEEEMTRISGDEDLGEAEGRRAEGLDLMFFLPWRTLMEAVLSKLCWFIRGLLNDNFKLSVS